MSTDQKSRRYFCSEPWTGLFSVNVDGAVKFCPCYAQVKIGNIRDADINEIWNSPIMQDIRSHFAQGQLPDCCSGQTCPPVNQPFDDSHSA